MIVIKERIVKSQDDTPIYQPLYEDKKWCVEIKNAKSHKTAKGCKKNGSKTNKKQSIAYHKQGYANQSF